MTELADAGARVLLVVADLAEWRTEPDTPGVTLHRLGSTELPQILRAARKFLLTRDGPLAGASLLVAGDPEAMPIADAARRRFPSLSVGCAPAPGPARRPAPADLAVVTPWYPSPNDPFAGAFVRATTDAAGGDVGRVATLHTEGWPYSPKGVSGKLVGVAVERELAHGGGVVVADTPEGELTRVVSPQPSNGDYFLWSREQIARLRAALPTGRIEAPLVHAHTGHYAGAVAAELARDDARIVVTEHATFLDLVFALPASRRQYGDMLHRVNRMLCVGRALYDQVAAQFPEHLEKLRVLPNPIDFDRFAVRPEPPREPLRLLYVGRMVPHKGVLTLLEAFARIAGAEPRATLTLVGSGALELQLRARIAELGLVDRVTQRAPVAPEQVAGLMHEHDVLIHASGVETFGMTIVEAVATGTPVLVARSQGPAETLHGLDGVAGVLFDVTEDPEVIVAGYRRLRAGWSGLGLAQARERLRARYGREAVGAQLREVYREVAQEPPATRPEAGPPEPPEADNRSLIRRLKHGLVTTLPRRGLDYLRARSRKLSSPTPEAWVITAQRAHVVLAGWFDRKVDDPKTSIGADLTPPAESVRAGVSD
ncbi:hypothetical protein DMB66_17535 [Actinoplanes sp. ATCC 53533]|nr:hypothetical protein DMB66_17535 [Actinoplanes sp. ATCC 53533]